ncbi:hypothetical protein HY030_01050 [Candidatus Gottesmanbacteria bacterium]|nr:hypothetical protein [Candidatus Gottesmanbacteria bacterium]
MLESKMNLNFLPPQPCFHFESIAGTSGFDLEKRRDHNLVEAKLVLKKHEFATALVAEKLTPEMETQLLKEIAILQQGANTTYAALHGWSGTKHVHI